MRATISGPFRQALWTALVVTLAAAPAFGDEIKLRNGSVFSGRVVREDERVVVLEVDSGRIEFKKADIVSHVRDATPLPPRKDAPVKQLPVRPAERPASRPAAPKSQRPIVPVKPGA